MPKKLRRCVLASLVIAIAMAISVASALGIGGVDTSVPALQQPSQLSGSAPQVSVPQVSVPSAPSVPSVPSAPSTPSVSVPSVKAPSVPSTTSSTSGGGSPRSGGGAAGSSGSAGAAPGSGGSPPRTLQRSGGGGSAGSSPAATRRARAQAHERARNRRLISEVTSMRGCLGTLPALERRFLGLRAGLAGRALSRGAAAQRLGISMVRARGLERGGLRSMRGAARAGRCGTTAGSTAAQPFQLAARGSSMPAFQPAAMLAHPPALVSPHDLSGPRNARQGVAGETASSGRQGPAAPDEDSRTGGLAAAVAPAAGDTRSVSITVILAIVFGLFVLASGTLLASRRAARPGEPAEAIDWVPAAAAAAPPTARPEPEAELAWIPKPQPEPQAAWTPEPEPEVAAQADRRVLSEQNGHAHQNGDAPQNGNGAGHHNGNGNGAGHHNGNGNGNGSLQRVARPAAIAASSLVSLAVSRMVRGRRNR